MGTGISQVFASHKMDVRLIGRSAESLARAMGTIESNLAEFVDREILNESDAAAALARVRTDTDFGAAGETRTLTSRRTLEPKSSASTNSATQPTIHIFRSGWDSNPRDALAPSGFQDRRLRPLDHRSIYLTSYKPP